GFLGAWFFVILAPTSSIIPIKDLAFEHRMYLPLAAVVIVTLVLLDGLLRRFSEASPGRSGQMRFVRVALVVVVVGALGGRTLERNTDYRSRVSMWQDVVAQRPTNARAYCNLGVALTEEGRDNEAVVACRKAVELDPTFVSGHFRLG
ncbi:MAG: tetratricopeptide repeat protein, partial [Planctomycetes bacterium]|nr:tetratricopeptide repeat protein [Planctomycetota bacterium]